MGDKEEKKELRTRGKKRGKEMKLILNTRTERRGGAAIIRRKLQKSASALVSRYWS
jgi:hypothetical protein